MKEILNFLYNKIHNLKVITQYQINIFSLFHQSHSSVYLHFPHSGDKFSCKKMFEMRHRGFLWILFDWFHELLPAGIYPLKVNNRNIRVSIVNFEHVIAGWTYHRNLIEPSLESRKFPPCGDILQIVNTTRSLITTCFLQLQWKISHTIMWRSPGSVTKFQKE